MHLRLAVFLGVLLLTQEPTFQFDPFTEYYIGKPCPIHITGLTRIISCYQYLLCEYVPSEKMSRYRLVECPYGWKKDPDKLFFLGCLPDPEGECSRPSLPPPGGQETIGEPCKYANDVAFYIRPDGPSCDSYLLCDYLENGGSSGKLVWKEEFCPEAHNVVVDSNNDPTCVPGSCSPRRPSNWQFPCEKYTSNNQQEIFQDPFDCTLAWTCYYSSSLDTWQVTLRNFCENNENGDRFFSKSEDHPLGTTVACTEGCVWHSLSLKIREEEGF